MLLNQKKEIQEVFEQILGIPLDFKMIPSEEENQVKEDFIKFINDFELVWSRQKEFEELFKVDFSTYDDKFFRLIESLIHFSFNTEAAEAILFYIYSRHDDEGNLNIFMDPEGEKYTFTSPDDLWDYIVKIIEQNLNDDEMFDL